MLTVIIRSLCCAAAGFCCGIFSRRWIRSLLTQRKLEYTLTPKAEWLLNIAGAVLGAAVGWFASGIPAALCGLGLLTICLTLSVTDWTHRLIPNPTVLALLVLKLVFGIPALLNAPGFPPFRVLSSLIGLAACMALFALPGLFGKNVGAGDIKLAAATGFFFGFPYCFLAVFVMGLLVIGYTLIQRRIPLLKFFREYIPIGPFIAAGILAVYIFSPVISRYLAEFSSLFVQ